MPKMWRTIPLLLGGVRGGLEYNKTFYLAKDLL